MALYQLKLPTLDQPLPRDYYERLDTLLSQDLDFHGEDSGYATHGYHSFPAKFPPQLPRKFITSLTEPGDLVLDPMMGSGTTVLETVLADRAALGFDIDPLAAQLTKVKITPLDMGKVMALAQDIVSNATVWVQEKRGVLQERLESRWDARTRRFVNYWFASETQVELLALIQEIEKIPEETLRAFFELTFSSIIITKSGGVSMAFDLAHTRPHRVKVVFSQAGEIIRGKDVLESLPPSKHRYQVKRLRSPLEEFSHRIAANSGGALQYVSEDVVSYLSYGNAQAMPLRDDVVDLVVTSPPYASNAIDYMRAHKFSLVWLGYSIARLGEKRQDYIGGEATSGFDFEALPPGVQAVISEISDLDEKKGRVLQRYYSEMTRVLGELLRVLKPGRAAIMVVGTSTMRGIDTKTHTCLAEIGEALGFATPLIGVRNLDRDRRMMPASVRPDLDSQIQQRMHVEYVLGFYKPEA